MPDPATIAMILQQVKMLGDVGSSYLGRNDVKRAQREQDRRVGYSNIINSFGGNSQPSPVQVKSSGATNFLRGLSDVADTGSQAASMFGQVQALNRSRGLADEAAQFDLDKSKGVLSGQAARLTDNVFSAPPAQAAPGVGTIGARANRPDQFAAPPSQFAGKLPSLSGPQLSGFADPASVMASVGELQGTGKLAAQATVNQRRSTQEALQAKAEAAAQAAQREFTQQQFENRLDLAGHNLDVQKAGGEAAGDKFEKLAGLVEGAAGRGETWQEITANPLFGGLGDEDAAALKNSYDSAAYAKAAETNDNVAGFLFGNLKSKYAANSAIKKSADLSFGMNLMAMGYEQQNSIGDLAMVQATVRLSDPGLGVRPSEAEQAEMTQGFLDIYAPGMTIQRLKAGDKFSPEHRLRMLEAAEDLYSGQIELIDNALEDEYDAAIRSVRGFGGTDDDLLRFNRTYALEPLSTYNYKKRTPMFDFSGGGGNRSTATLGGNY